jgi:hypothetical protein
VKQIYPASITGKGSRFADGGSVLDHAFGQGDPYTLGVDTGSDVEGFQRRFVWKKFKMDRFVESLLLGYPVPAIFLVQQPNKKMLVLDGQQRLRTLQYFFSGKLRDGAAFRRTAPPRGRPPANEGARRQRVISS